MPRRYGRNQKRRHREEIARLSQAYAMADGLSKRLGAGLREAQSTIAEMVSAIESVCTYSVALPPKKVAGNGDMDYYRVPVRNIDFAAVVGGNSDMNMSYRTIDLYALRAFLDNHREQFQTAIHLEYSGGKHSAYMISEQGLCSIPRETLMRGLLPDITRQLIDHLRSR